MVENIQFILPVSCRYWENLQNTHLQAPSLVTNGGETGEGITPQAGDLVLSS